MTCCYGLLLQKKIDSCITAACMFLILHHSCSCCYVLLPDCDCAIPAAHHTHNSLTPLLLLSLLFVALFCRVGRTARYTASGRSLLLLLPSERDAMLAQLAEAKVPLQQLKHNPHKVMPIGPSLSALLSKNAELKAFAQSALVSYCRSVYLQPNKDVFDAAALPLEVRIWWLSRSTGYCSQLY
jgi:hypothetical protein